MFDKRLALLFVRGDFLPKQDRNTRAFKLMVSRVRRSKAIKTIHVRGIVGEEKDEDEA